MNTSDRTPTTTEVAQFVALALVWMGCICLGGALNGMMRSNGPNQGLFLAFNACFIVNTLGVWLFSQSRAVATVFALGGISNAVAMMANGGFMPVHSRYYEDGVSKMHVELTEAHSLPWLTDVLPLSFSAGDALMLSSAPVFYCLWLWRRRRNEGIVVDASRARGGRGEGVGSNTMEVSSRNHVGEEYVEIGEADEP